MNRKRGAVDGDNEVIKNKQKEEKKKHMREYSAKRRREKKTEKQLKNRTIE